MRTPLSQTMQNVAAPIVEIHNARRHAFRVQRDPQYIDWGLQQRPGHPVGQQPKSAVGGDQLTETVHDDGRIRQVAVEDMLKGLPNRLQQRSVRP